jgi:hypothetical protein
MDKEQKISEGFEPTRVSVTIAEARRVLERAQAVLVERGKKG